LAYPDDSANKNLGEFYFAVYQYAPIQLWSSLDNLYKICTDLEPDLDKARALFIPIAHELSNELKTEPPKIQKMK